MEDGTRVRENRGGKRDGEIAMKASIGKGVRDIGESHFFLRIVLAP